jgi:hypothetical protein
MNRRNVRSAFPALGSTEPRDIRATQLQGRAEPQAAALGHLTRRGLASCWKSRPRLTLRTLECVGIHIAAHGSALSSRCKFACSPPGINAHNPAAFSVCTYVHFSKPPRVGLRGRRCEHPRALDSATHIRPAVEGLVHPQQIYQSL